MTARYKDIEFQIVDRVARVAFARPPLNVFTIAMMKELTTAIQGLDTRPDVCAVVFSASSSSRAFSAGVSIEEHRPDTVFQMLDAFHAVFRALNAISKPVVAVVEGAALGGGCEIVAFADIVIASHSARFGQPEIKLGVFPPVAAVVLPRVIGRKKSREMIMTGELVGAEEALAIGLVNYLVEESEIESKTEEVLNKLRHLSAPGLEMTRRALMEAEGLPFDEALKRAENVYLNQLMSLRDPHEGIESFIAKRPPQWKHK